MHKAEKTVIMSLTFWAQGTLRDLLGMQ